jgi:PAS domain S-box-containing protein
MGEVPGADGRVERFIYSVPFDSLGDPTDMSSALGSICVLFRVPMPTDLPVEARVDHALEHWFIAECNDTYARTHGFRSREELIGKPVSAIWHGHPTLARERIAYNVASSGPMLYRIAWHTPDGRNFELLYSMAKIDHEGKILGTLGTTVEISTLLKAEAAERERLEFSQAHQRLLVELATHPALAEGRLEEIARAATEGTTRLLEAERTSVWLINRDRAEYQLVDRLERGSAL